LNTILNRIAVGLAFIIGTMAIFAGGQVLLGKAPGYFVINWLPVYNYTVGVITVFTSAALMWTKSRYALPFALGTFGAHALVMLLLQSTYRDVGAVESVVAMSIRLIIWMIILGLLFFARQRVHSLTQ
jgi:hypothetical protein